MIMENKTNILHHDEAAVKKALDDYYAETGHHASPTMMRYKMDMEAIEDAMVMDIITEVLDNDMGT